MKVMENGKRIIPDIPLAEIASYSSKRLDLLPKEYKRFENPHTYKIGVSKKLFDLRSHLVDQHKKQKSESTYPD